MYTIQKTSVILFTTFILVSCAITACAEVYDQTDAGILLSEGKISDAESVLNKKLSVNNKDVVALSLLGEVYRQKGGFSKALKYLNKAISIDPKYTDSYLYKGKLFFSMQKFDEISSQFDLYMQNMEPLVADDAKRQVYIANLHDVSVIYFGLKRYEELKAVLDRILKLSPDDQAAIYNLGIYYYTYERNRSGAYSSFSKVIAIDPATETAAKARYAIEFMRANPDPRVAPSFSFIDQEFRN